MTHMLVFGYGYSARAIGAALMAEGWQVSGTSRSAEGVAAIATTGASGLLFTGRGTSDDARRAIETATHILVSIAPGEAGDPVLAHFAAEIASAPRLNWLGYLSTVGVYGNHDGGWVDETTTPQPVSKRSIQRLAAEQAWQRLAKDAGLPLQIFRLSGIYGPGRSAFDKLRAGTARRLIKPGQVFNRIHVADIAGAVLAGVRHPEATGVFNVTDDLPGPPQDVIAEAAKLLGVPPPPETPFETADLSPMARSFYGENKRVSNRRVKADLGYQFRCPTFHEGLRALI